MAYYVGAACSGVAIGGVLGVVIFTAPSAQIARMKLPEDRRATLLEKTWHLLVSDGSAAREDILMDLSSPQYAMKHQSVEVGDLYQSALKCNSTKHRVFLSLEDKFAFAGPVDGITSTQAYNDIFYERYVQCRFNLGGPKTILVGTQSCLKCNEFALALIRDMIKHADEGIDHTMSCSDTPVFREGKQIGDLAHIPRGVSLKKEGHVVCEELIAMRTRLSGNQSVRRPAVVVGASDPSVCKEIAISRILRG